LPLIYFYYIHLVYVCFVTVTSLRIVIDGNKLVTYLNFVQIGKKSRKS